MLRTTVPAESSISSFTLSFGAAFSLMLNSALPARARRNAGLGS
jgi:hypothetical protein